MVDLEGDGLTPTKIHCLSVRDEKGKVFSTTNYDEMRSFFLKDYVIVIHNGIRFDKRVIERLLGIKIASKIIDTLAVSFYLYPNRNRHGLESWGDEFKVPKPYITDWQNQTVEQYIYRCEQDTLINLKLWEKMYLDLHRLYKSKKEIWRLLDYLGFKFECAAMQEDYGWHVDKEYAEKCLKEMEEERDKKVEVLKNAMPKVPQVVVKSKPKRFKKKDGSYTALGLKWIALCKQHNYPKDYDGDIEVITGYEDGNPSSHVQIKNWLKSLGWKPQTFKYKRDKKDNSLTEIPQINLPDGKGLCDSIKDLFEKEPRLEVLDELSILGHRIPLIKGILKSLDENNDTKAQVQGLTNTLRFIHRTVVNLPRVDRPWSEGVRGSLVAREGMILCGADMSSLEDRIKQHFIFPHDPDYVKQMNNEDFDPHLEIARLAGMMSVDDILEYKTDKKGEAKWKPVRSIAKNGNYACQYGAGVPRLMLTCSIEKDAAEKLHEAYWKLNWAIKVVADEQKTTELDGQMWLFNPISQLWYSLRAKKDIFSTLVQGTASFVFDQWVMEILERRRQLTAQFHDEVVLEIPENKQDECRILMDDTIATLNKKLNLNRELGIGVQFGYRYSEIH